MSPRAVVAGAILLGLLACASPPDPNTAFRPTESVLEVVAPLRLHVDDDTYRRSPARDFTGKNIYRASFARLESLEASYATKFRSGYLQDVIWFAMARSLERITEYSLAAKLYGRVERLDSELAQDAITGRLACERLDRAAAMMPSGDATPQQALERFAARIALQEEVIAEFDEPIAKSRHLGYVAREELERSDWARAEYFGARRKLDPSLDTVALQAYQDLVRNHPESKNRNRNLLELAGFYEELARDYVRICPSVALCFDAATFDEYVFGASRLYESVSQQDGAVEKIEAKRRLEVLLAYVLQVYDDKLPQRPQG